MNDYENIKWVSDPNTVPPIPQEPARFINVDRELVQTRSQLNMAKRELIRDREELDTMSKEISIYLSTIARQQEEIKRYQDERKALVFALNDARITIARLEQDLAHGASVINRYAERIDDQDAEMTRLEQLLSGKGEP